MSFLNIILSLLLASLVGGVFCSLFALGYSQYDDESVVIRTVNMVFMVLAGILVGFVDYLIVFEDAKPDASVSGIVLLNIVVACMVWISWKLYKTPAEFKID